MGDFTVSMGQGLIQWQGFASRKSSDVMAVKRSASVLSPYNSAGEFNFHRGVGITLVKNNWELTVFGSLRNRSGNIIVDSIQHEEYVSSFNTSGYHRTASESDNRNRLQQSAIGTTLKYRGPDWHISLNGVYYNFSRKILKRDELYNLFSLHGKSWMNAGID